MHIGRNARRLAGLALLLAAVGLSLPGVRAVRADAETPPPASATAPVAGPTCNVVPRRSRILVPHPSASRELPPRPAGEVPVSLNTRGYNYQTSAFPPEWAPRPPAAPGE